MRKITSLLLILTVAAGLSGCRSEKEDKEFTKAFDEFDYGMETFFDQYQELTQEKMELIMLIAESDDTDEIFAKFHDIDDKTDKILLTVDGLENSYDKELAAQSSGSRTAYAASAEDVGINAGLRDYGIMKSVGNFLTKNQYRDQDESMRMGIYAGYQEIRNQFPGDLPESIDPLLKEAGIEKIEDIFYCDLDKVETFYKKAKELPEGFGQNFQSYKNDMYETLREGNSKDMQNYMDNVTSMIAPEIEAGHYDEYVPKHIADFMIRTQGYEDYLNYIEKRRGDRLQLSAEVAGDDWQPPDLIDLMNNLQSSNGNTNYYGQGYEKSDNEEFIIAYNQDTDQLLVTKVDTNNSNEINLPPGNYQVLGTTDGNAPVYSEEVGIKEGETTTLQTTTTKDFKVSPGLLNLISSLGQTTFALPTKADLQDKQNELLLQRQLKDQLEHQLEILRSMEGGSFTTVSPEARDKINSQLAEVNKQIKGLEAEVGLFEGLEDVLDETSTGDEEDRPVYPAFLNAVGSWKGDYGDGGTLDIEFPSDGGPITGHFGGCPGGTCWSSTATGQFDGGENGSVSGNIDGYMTATEYTPMYNISGTFSGSVNLRAGTASGTYTIRLYGGGSSYADPGSWSATFDNGQ
ncbi:MAG: hypothetical protein ABIH78_00815 [Candidatus Peregrinibacteria bacterium]